MSMTKELQIAATLNAIAAAVAAYRQRTEAEEYTDVGDAWDLFDYIEVAAREAVKEQGASKRAFAQQALDHLMAARDALRAAGASRTLERLSQTISSAKGAVRAAGYRDQRAEEAREERYRHAGERP
jgi:hypothetical protein